MPELLRSNVADQVSRAIGVAVDMAIEASDSAMTLDGPAIFTLIELLLRKRCYQAGEIPRSAWDSECR